MSTQQKGVANRLINEKSPYLLQHAYNPVDWYPWCEEAFAKAVSEDKPVFLSIGYSTCHWCHVMERESFLDDEVAELLNKDFVAIKVDREERPDIDNIYMNFCQMITGSGGWPLTVVLNPKDKKPFFAGTYFPKESKGQYSGMIDLLPEITYAWENKRDELEKVSEEIMRALEGSAESDISLSSDDITDTYANLNYSFDSVYGGFGYAPKFPTPHNLLFLLRYYITSKDDNALNIVTKTLDSMYEGGIFDHIGFGFSRYSTDNKWLVPHFEKMLYDNALLLIAYLETYQVTKNNLYKEVAEKIISYILRDMTSDEGGFYSAEDADSEGVEGKFYVFTKSELIDVLGEGEGKLFCKHYNVSENGNFEGKNILNLIKTTTDDLENDQKMIKKIFDYRKQRVHPFKDDKILTSWNGLMIAALAIAGRMLENQEYISASEKAVAFIEDKLFNENGRLFARFRDGEVSNLAYLEDYAFLIWGLIELYETTFKVDYLKKAIELTNETIKYFWDEKDGGFFIYGSDSEKLITRTKEIYDGATPSGNSVTTLNMLKLASMTGNIEFKEKAMKQFETFGGTVGASPNYYTYFMMAYLYTNTDVAEIVIAGNRENIKTRQMIDEINKRFLPFTTCVLNDGDGRLHEIIPFIKNQKVENDDVKAYVCQNFSCKEPISDIDEFVTFLSVIKL
ncbi:MAG TPA: thioredoxin domain-containing protein [Clostridiales bacterium]|nr:MAG: thioredoxin [Clostridiales bacterium GWD2_32_59]HAN09652.1 thioredoxin domain-containing protein [Clostridiales bacterium]